MSPGTAGEEGIDFMRAGVGSAGAEGGMSGMNVLGNRFKRTGLREAGEMLGEESMAHAPGHQHHRTALMGGLDCLEEVEEIESPLSRDSGSVSGSFRIRSPMSRDGGADGGSRRGSDLGMSSQ